MTTDNLCDLRGGPDWCSLPAGHAGAHDQRPLQALYRIPRARAFTLPSVGDRLLYTTAAGRPVCTGIVMSIDVPGQVIYLERHIPRASIEHLLVGPFAASPPPSPFTPPLYELDANMLTTLDLVDGHLFVVLSPGLLSAKDEDALDRAKEQLLAPLVAVTIRLSSWLDRVLTRRSR